MARSIKQINQLIEELNNLGYTYPTQYERIYMKHPLHIIPPELNRGGQLRTYREVKKYFEQKGLNKKFMPTPEQFKQERQELMKELSKVDTKTKFISERHNTYTDQIYDALGMSVDISMFTTEELRDILNEAWRQTKRDSRGSPTFAEHLMEVISEYQAAKGYEV